MKKIKVMHFLYNLSNGGVESILLNYFSNMDKSLFIPCVVIQGRPDINCKKRFTDNGFKVIELNTKKREPYTYYKTIKKLINNEKPDIVHAHMNGSNFFPLYIAKKCGVKVRISHSHMIKIKKSFADKIKNYLSIKSANIYMSCGYDAGEYMYGKTRMNNGEVIVLNNAIDYDKYAYNEDIRNMKRKELQIENNFVIGNIGRFVLQKNHYFLINIFKNIKKEISNAKLLLVGTGELKDEIINILKQEDLLKDTIMLADRSDINELLMAMDVFVFPSLFEGLPVVVIEAQAANLKCLLADTITKHCKINDNTEFLPLNNIDEWQSKIIKSYKEKINRNKVFNNLDYDIKKQAIKLEKIYLNSIKGE